jgi:hypothetical protein
MNELKGLTREVHVNYIAYKNKKGGTVKYIGFDGELVYDDSVKKRVWRWSRIRKDHGPSFIAPNGDRGWYNTKTRVNICRDRRVGNNRNSKSKDYSFFRAKYGIQRIETRWSINYFLYNIALYSDGQKMFFGSDMLRQVVKTGAIVNYGHTKGPSYIHQTGFRKWNQECSHIIAEATQKGNPKKTYGTSKYIMERYEYSKGS